MGVSGQNRRDARVGVEQREHGVPARAGVQRLVAGDDHVALAGGGQRVGEEGQRGLGDEAVGAVVAACEVEHDQLEVVPHPERVVKAAAIRTGAPGSRRAEARHHLAADR